MEFSRRDVGLEALLESLRQQAAEKQDSEARALLSKRTMSCHFAEVLRSDSKELAARCLQRAVRSRLTCLGHP